MVCINDVPDSTVVPRCNIDREIRGTNLGQKKFGSRFLICVYSQANSAIRSTLIGHGHGEDEMARKGTDHALLYAVANKTSL